MADTRKEEKREKELRTLERTARNAETMLYSALGRVRGLETVCEDMRPDGAEDPVTAFLGRRLGNAVEDALDALQRFAHEEVPAMMRAAGVRPEDESSMEDLIRALLRPRGDGPGTEDA